MRPLAVLAFGGNALLRSNQVGTYEEQFQNVENTCRQILPLIRWGYDIVICHGNGPQVGNVLLQQEAGRHAFGLQKMPMDVCGAETQGAIAYMIETAMDRVMYAGGITTRRVISLVTRVEVDPRDPMFKNPTKPVGPFYPGGGGGTPRRRDRRRVQGGPEGPRLAQGRALPYTDAHFQRGHCLPARPRGEDCRHLRRRRHPRHLGGRRLQGGGGGHRQGPRLGPVRLPDWRGRPVHPDRRPEGLYQLPET